MNRGEWNGNHTTKVEIACSKSDCKNYAKSSGLTQLNWTFAWSFINIVRYLKLPRNCFMHKPKLCLKSQNIHQHTKGEKNLFSHEKHLTNRTDQLIISICNVKYFLSQSVLAIHFNYLLHFLSEQKKNSNKQIKRFSFRLFYYAGCHQLRQCRDMFWCFNQTLIFMKKLSRLSSSLTMNSKILEIQETLAIMLDSNFLSQKWKFCCSRLTWRFITSVYSTTNSKRIINSHQVYWMQRWKMISI